MAGPSDGEEAPARGTPLRKHLLVFVLGAVAVVAVVQGVRWVAGDRAPPLDPGWLESAEETWHEQGIEDYDLRLRKRTNRADDEVFEVEVRDGTVDRVMLDGRELERRVSSYSIQGLFDTMRRELEMAKGRERAEGARQSAFLTAMFHERLGFPIRFTVLAEPANLSFWIEVEEFRVPGEGRIWP